jgi:hypothetical protein
MGTVYYGDNLDILPRYLKDETVDLVYLDPSFNSAQNYNAFFHEKDGTEAARPLFPHSLPINCATEPKESERDRKLILSHPRSDNNRRHGKKPNSCYQARPAHSTADGAIPPHHSLSKSIVCPEDKDPLTE